ncbi:MAG: FkbM family methyltransferase [Cryomorphaceae bacterium]
MIRSISNPPKLIYQHLYFYGPFEINVEGVRFKMNSLCTQFENNIFWRGVSAAWEYQSILLWKKLTRNSNVIFDVGANSGFYSLLSVAANPKSDVYAFEPVQRNAQILRDNLRLNDFQVSIQEKAVSNISGDQYIYDIRDVKNNRQASLTKSTVYGRDAEKVKVISTRLDDFIAQSDIHRLDLIKIDVEEHEVEVLLGLSEKLATLKPAILIEVLNAKIGNHIFEILSKAGYQYYLNISEIEGAVEVDSLTPIVGRNFFCFEDKEHFNRLSFLNS